ncbi:MAG: glyceraldehyde-3-phosphate dehydrogenase [Candidatus Marinimicrobia bacterium]|nr:glyceraldehyde-3-phosphate dehydrogenase [Candidatus Neomarinimicrobiota bacterium]
MIRVGLMGFGRIGRNLYRLAAETDDVEIAVVSDIAEPEILHYLLQRDSIHGSFEKEARFENNRLILDDGRSARMVHGASPGDVPWDGYKVDLVIDATHKFLSKEHMEAHLASGARRVIIANLPEGGIDRVVLVGINDDKVQNSDRLISAGSSTTTAMALMLKIISSRFAIERAMMTTIHAYTSDQPLQDSAGTDFRRSRSAADNIIPNTTDSPGWVEKIMPEFAGKLEGIALNVPVADGSLLDLTLHLENADVSIDDVNQAARDAAAKQPNIIGITEDPIVSSDVIGNRHSVVFDTRATMKSQGRMVKVIGWYDNGWGHAARMLNLVRAYANLNGQGGAA